MASLMENLIDILNEQYEAYSALVELSARKTPIIVKGSLEELQTITDEEQLAEFKKTMPLGFGAPRHIALGCVYLLSDASCWTTGTSLVIDGGQTLI